ncbi:CLUMA_CG010151, isoform A [Clunio marinus]|uniref:CLUMA_CG010151, isoform A n=1 Tax=Clunio marinus TaxID=568069 RepID=A0A1J1I9X1_9DIPT|nr:CLUMA_CG010151, isoform A [Clunio marinus]
MATFTPGSCFMLFHPLLHLYIQMNESTAITAKDSVIVILTTFLLVTRRQTDNRISTCGHKTFV